MKRITLGLSCILAISEAKKFESIILDGFAKYTGLQITKTLGQRVPEMGEYENRSSYPKVQNFGY